jgi:hypothetical protein
MHNTCIVKQKEPQMEAFKSWEEMSVLEQMACQYWDMYKDAYGVRPRGIDTSTWTETDFEQEFASLGSVIEREEADRKVAEAKAMHDFEMRMQTLMMTGARDRATAMRWIHEAEDTGGDDEYLCFTLGLPYRYFAQKELA